MEYPQIIKRVLLGPMHQPTGNTRHNINGVPMPAPVELRIVKYDVADRGYYLYYCDRFGTEMTYTYHDSVEEAMAQAEWEFNVKKDEWQNE